MPLIARQLALMQLSDSAFPSGSFTLSHGLESLVYSGQIKTADDFQEFLRLLLYNKIGTSDLVALLHAHRASVNNNLVEIRRADLRLFASTTIAQTREAQRKSGRALLMVAQSIWQDTQLETLATDTAAGTIQCLHPVIFAVLGRTVLLSESDTVLAFVHSFITSLALAAIRLGVIGHIQAQVVINAITLDIEPIINNASNMTLEDMRSCTPVIDIAQMRHKHLNQRQFAN
ncbi:urease accessory protein UreF [Chlorogloea sp. CCALA 695]|uniref:urease accessory protein UreF n=1 Tax=Chlorogloea sp. CCALA 695 TaxID=2107693 RepID=UPI000D056FA8|nr:urease accessory UreF family protein [Chlorogloea sp. CCALA 695]PSB30248.1 urease accessory protein UreF [Chlorogloea sp. CCALA 695]